MFSKKNKPKKEYKTEVSFLDASKGFLYSVTGPIIGALIYVILLILIGNFFGFTYHDVFENSVVQIINILFTHVVFALFILYLFKKNNINVCKAAGFSNNINYKYVLIITALSFGIAFLISPFISLMDYCYTLFGYDPSGSLPFALSNFGYYVLAIVLMAAIPAIVEEVLFRGIIFKGLTKKLKPMKAILISAFCFMIIHGSLQQTIFQFLMGVVFAYLLYITGNILYPIILHFLNNFIVITVEYITIATGSQVKIESYDTAWSIIYPILMLIVGLAVIAGACYLVYFLEAKQKIKTEKANLILNKQQDVKTETISPINASEKVLLYFGAAIGCAYWLLNTLGTIFNWSL